MYGTDMARIKSRGNRGLFLSKVCETGSRPHLPLSGIGIAAGTNPEIPHCGKKIYLLTQARQEGTYMKAKNRLNAI